MSTYNLLRNLMLCLFTVIVITSATAQNKRALIVGISEYPKVEGDSWVQIHGANDAVLITPILKRQGFTATKVCNKSATAKRIRTELNNLIARCKPGDMVYLHFSCHGQAYEDMDGDEEDGWDESIIPYDAQKAYKKGEYEGANHITDDELHKYFQKLRNKVGAEGFVCVVIDACHAGNASRGEEEDEIFMRGTRDAFTPHGKLFTPRINANGRFIMSKGKDQADILVIEACRSYEVNYEIREGGKYYGPLSYYVSQVLLSQDLSRSTGWVMKVKEKMAADRRLTKQNMVYETSIR